MADNVRFITVIVIYMKMFDKVRKGGEEKVVI